MYLEGARIAGFLTALPLAMKLDDVRKTIHSRYGGGKFNVYLDPNNGGDYIGCVGVEIPGPPKIPTMKCDCPLSRMMNQGCQISWHK